MFSDESNQLETYKYVRTKLINKFKKYKSIRGPTYLKIFLLSLDLNKQLFNTHV